MTTNGLGYIKIVGRHDGILKLLESVATRQWNAQELLGATFSHEIYRTKFSFYLSEEQQEELHVSGWWVSSDTRRKKAECILTLSNIIGIIFLELIIVIFTNKSTKSETYTSNYSQRVAVMRQEIDFIKFNPTQNMTVLVKTKHPVEEYKHIASKLMSYDNVYAEQVGFIEKPVKQDAAAHLQMAGGEFCGNACMALAAFIAAEKGLQPNDLTEIVLEASGTDHFVICQVKRNADEYVCQVTMPLPKKIERTAITYDGHDWDIVIVRYHDFIHIVIEVEEFDKTVRKTAQALAKLLGVTLGSGLIGILLYKSGPGEMAPLIYVPSLDSMVWERGCGSGTASLGAYLAWKNKGAVAAQIRQPGGTIRVAANWDQEEVTGLAIEGSVGIVAQGKAFIEV